MRKSIVTPNPATKTPISDNWRDLERIARVEITSEDAAFPIEHALGKAATSGWRAATTGPQVIRLFFDEPLAIKHLNLHFVEKTAERSQEFAVYIQTNGASSGGMRAASASISASRTASPVFVSRTGWGCSKAAICAGERAESCDRRRKLVPASP